MLEKNGKQYPVTPWPLDIERNVAERDEPALRQEPVKSNENYHPLPPMLALRQDPEPMEITTLRDDRKEIIDNLRKPPEWVDN